ncbi:MAG: helix-turn-helix transcriptional regulator [Lentihominibacter sp.]|nr:helix-turn-helix transcriptional regulator [Clostridiales bacterium]MDY2679369.1 helix-turn-helix transcriptional regulator [Lentihominibacter sp.]
MFVNEVILICYVAGLLLGVSGLTVAFLAGRKKKDALNDAFVLFFAGMLVICCYDMIIYYCDYVIGVLSNLKVLRIGNCIIAGTMLLWVNLQSCILEREALKLLDGLVKKYLVFYIAMWMLLTVFLRIEHFYTLKWLLLATDVILIVAFMASAVARIIYAAAAGMKIELYYMILVTAMLLWNYISYFWGETSVYWGNSRFIREPLDLTIVFWLIINAGSLFFAYHKTFITVLDREEDGMSDRRTLKGRINDVCEQYKLTPRERELMELIYAGMSNKEIAETLFLSESTVKTHIYNIFRKLEVKNRVGVICIINGDTDKTE